jgi:hypothetical protein
MKVTCVVCNEPFERGAGQSRSKYCSVECRKHGPCSSTDPSPAIPADGQAPGLAIGDQNCRTSTALPGVSEKLQ